MSKLIGILLIVGSILFILIFILFIYLCINVEMLDDDIEKDK